MPIYLRKKYHYPSLRSERKSVYPPTAKNPYREISLKEIESHILSLINKVDQRENNFKLWKSLEKKVSRYLLHVWRQNSRGISRPSDFFRVSCGIGSTMTAEDILNNRLVLTVMIFPKRGEDSLSLIFLQERSGE